jgi:molecular chaperone GrpE
MTAEMQPMARTSRSDEAKAADPPPGGVDGQAEGRPEDHEAALHERLAASEKALLETRTALLNALADQDNTRKLAAREREEAVRYAAAQLARDLLESLDNLRRAVDAAPQGDSVDGLLSGVIATERNLLAALAKHGIRKLDPLGDRFDPRFHEAVHQRADPNFNTGDVIEVIQPGYMIHDRLLRPAKVGVANNDQIEPASD